MHAWRIQHGRVCSSSSSSSSSSTCRPSRLPLAAALTALPALSKQSKHNCHRRCTVSSSSGPAAAEAAGAGATWRTFGPEGSSTSTSGSIQLRRLGRTDLLVPSICYGTMLFGESQDYATACELLDICMEAGVNFFDTAEMYPVPQRAETQGKSEEYLGRWMRHHSRDKVLVASKVSGPSCQMTWIRGGPHALDPANIRDAIDASLLRLQTDYIDLYQLHWPDRYVPMFGDLDYDPTYAYQSASPLEDQLEAVGRAIDAGKIRSVGLSNETPWGVMKAVQAADTPGSKVPRVASIQNAYSLTCRTFDIGLAEVCHLEGVSLLAYSPLAMGLLTGKYMAPDGGPKTARLNKYKGRYAEAELRYGPKPNVLEAVAAYAELAEEHGMTPTAMALRFVLRHPLVASAVIGATTQQQLEELLTAAVQGPLQDEQLLEQIDKIHQKYPNPTP